MSVPRARRLRSGFTTGTAAAAAAKAAVLLLLENQSPEHVEVRLLTGDSIRIAVQSCRRIDADTARCAVIKDAGDDPDVTHKSQIGATVHLGSGAGELDVRITGGPGIGTVTKPGLGIAVGQAAITEGPRQMIHESVASALAGHPEAPLAADVCIDVPGGGEIARKTLNARLGIMGGISILGTTGVVRPLSHEAYLATIDAALSVARAGGGRSIVFATGRRSERFAQHLWPHIPPERFVQIGDYFAGSMQMATGHGFEQATLAVFFGKAVKMAQGIAHTHAHKARLTLDQLAQWALAVSGSADFARRVQHAHTARHAFDFIRQEQPALIAHVGRQAAAAAQRFGHYRIRVRIVIFDFDGTPCFDSECCNQIKQFKTTEHTENTEKE